MAEYNRYADGSFTFSENQLVMMGKFLGNKERIVSFITYGCANPQEIEDFVCAVVKITKAAEMWAEKKREDGENG